MHLDRTNDIDFTRRLFLLSKELDKLDERLKRRKTTSFYQNNPQTKVWINKIISFKEKRVNLAKQWKKFLSEASLLEENSLIFPQSTIKEINIKINEKLYNYSSVHLILSYPSLIQRLIKPKKNFDLYYNYRLSNDIKLISSYPFLFEDKKLPYLLHRLLYFILLTFRFAFAFHCMITISTPISNQTNEHQ